MSDRPPTWVTRVLSKRLTDGDAKWMRDLLRSGVVTQHSFNDVTDEFEITAVVGGKIHRATGPTVERATEELRMITRHCAEMGMAA